MEGGDGGGIAFDSVEILHSKDLFRHVALLIDPGIGTAHQPAVSVQMTFDAYASSSKDAQATQAPSV
jgi:hypothetical protein